MVKSIRRSSCAVLLLVASLLVSTPAGMASGAPAPNVLRQHTSGPTAAFAAAECAETTSKDYYAQDFAVSASGRTGLATNDGFVSDVARSTAYNAATSPPARTGFSTSARGTAVSIHPNNVTAYLSDVMTNTIQVVDLSGPTPVKINAFPLPNGTDVEVSPDGKYLYVVNDRLSADGKVTSLPYLRVYSLADSTRYPKRVASLRLSDSAHGIAVAPQGRSAAISTDSGIKIVRLTNPAAPSIVASVNFPNAAPVTYSRDGSKVFAGSGLPTRYATIDLATRTVSSIRTIRQADGDFLGDLEVSADNKTLYVGTVPYQSARNTFYAFDIKSGAVTYLNHFGVTATVAVSRAGTTAGTVYVGGLTEANAGSYLCTLRPAGN